MNEETNVAVISPETEQFWAWILKEFEALAGLLQTHTMGKQTSVQEDELINKLWLRYQLKEK
jgi:hypothetical protein